MKFRYIKNRLKYGIVIGALYAISGIIIILICKINNNTNGTAYSVGLGILSVAPVSLLISLFEHKNQYLSIKNSILTKHTLFPVSINLKQEISVKKFAGDFTLKTKDKKFIIDTHIINASCLEKLSQELNKYNVTWE
jgi:hypothetical protein